MTAPTAEQADEFERQVTTWQTRLGLADWRIHMSPKRAQGYMALMHKFDLTQRVVECKLGNSWWPNDLNSNGLERIAAHENLHVLLHELIETAKTHPADEDLIASVEHRVINAIVPLLVPKVD